jgi:hypothetical protein
VLENSATISTDQDGGTGLFGPNQRPEQSIDTRSGCEIQGQQYCPNPGEVPGLHCFEMISYLYRFADFGQYFAIPF